MQHIISDTEYVLEIYKILLYSSISELIYDVFVFLFEICLPATSHASTKCTYNNADFSAAQVVIHDKFVPGVGKDRILQIRCVTMLYRCDIRRLL